MTDYDFSLTLRYRHRHDKFPIAVDHDTVLALFLLSPWCGCFGCCFQHLWDGQRSETKQERLCVSTVSIKCVDQQVTSSDNHFRHIDFMLVASCTKHASEEGRSGLRRAEPCNVCSCEAAAWSGMEEYPPKRRHVVGYLLLHLRARSNCVCPQLSIRDHHSATSVAVTCI